MVECLGCHDSRTWLLNERSAFFPGSNEREGQGDAWKPFGAGSVEALEAGYHAACDWCYFNEVEFDDEPDHVMR